METRMIMPESMVFEIERCILAMVPIDNVIKILLESHEETSVSMDECYHNISTIFVSILLSILPQLLYQPNSSFKNTTTAAHVVSSSIYEINFQDPSLSIHQLSYIRKLILRFASRLNENKHSFFHHHLTATPDKPDITVDTMDILMEDDDMSWLWLQLNQTKICTEIPNPDKFCHVSFVMPDDIAYCRRRRLCHTTTHNNISNRIGQDHGDPYLRIRVFPHHNDVGVRRVWEAGCCLAEYLSIHPHHVRGKVVFELGSGVGLTGLFVAKTCQPNHVHMTDATPYCLDNLSHNLDINRSWLESMSVLDTSSSTDPGGETLVLDPEDPMQFTTTNKKLCSITSGYYNWKDDISLHRDEEKDDLFTDSSSYHWFQDANVLLAADVLYDRDDIPYLVKTIQSFLSLTSSFSTSSTNCTKDNNDHPNKVAIFATTMRNQETFQLFERELSRLKIIHSQSVPSKIIDNLPKLFPCYFIQPRSDVCITIFSLSGH